MRIKIYNLQFSIYNLINLFKKNYTFYIINSKLNRGFTLIELLIYMTLLSLFITGAVYFSWDIIYSREKILTEQMADQSAKIALSKISYEISRADDIQSISDNQIVLTNNSATTTISLSEGKIQMTSAGAVPFNLTSNQVYVLSPPQIPLPLFTNLGTTNNNSKNIKVSLTLRQSNASPVDKLETKITLDKSIEFNKKFNQARSLLVNASQSTLINNNQNISNVALENSGTANIIIDKIYLSWIGAPTANATQISINGTGVWSGSAASGNENDITNTTLNAGISNIPLIINFNSSMAGTIVTIRYIMNDGSNKETIIDFT